MLFIFLSAKGQNEVYNSFLNLEFEKTRASINTKANLSSFDIYVDNLNDCTELILNEDRSKYDSYKKRYQNRIDLLDDLPDEPIKGFVASEIRLQWAFISGKFGNNWNAFWTLRKALIHIEDNISAYPEYLPNYRTQGLLNIVLDLVPDNRKWLLNFFSMSGDFEKGYDQLKSSTTISSPFAEESKAILALVDSYILEKSTEIDSIQNQAVFRYLRGLTLAKQHVATEAATSFETLSDDLSIKPYLLAEAYFNSARYEEAVEMYSRFLANPSVENYRKDAFLKIGLSIWFDQDNEDKAKEFVERARAETKADSEVDKNAQRILERIEELNKEFMMLRYALDGGDYARAQSMISKIENQDLTDYQALEFDYRKARYYQLTNQHEQAIESYTKVIETGNRFKEAYFVPYSYLQLGRIYESQNNLEAAKMYYENTLEFEDHTYKQSIDLKARVALNELAHLND